MIVDFYRYILFDMDNRGTFQIAISIYLPMVVLCTKGIFILILWANAALGFIITSNFVLTMVSILLSFVILHACFPSFLIRIAEQMEKMEEEDGM